MIVIAIIKIENNTSTIVNVDTDFVEQKSANNYIRTTITEEDLFEQLAQNTNPECVDFSKQILKDAVSNGYYVDWNTGSFAVKVLCPNGSGLKVSFFVVDRKGLTYLMQSGEQLKRLGLDPQLSRDYAQRTAQLFQKLSAHQK